SAILRSVIGVVTPFGWLVVLLLEGNAPVTFSVNHRPDSPAFYTLPGTLTLLDEVLGLEQRQRLSPWLRQIAAALAVEMPYHRAAEVLRVVTLENVDIRGMTLWQAVQEIGEGLRQRAAEE